MAPSASPARIRVGHNVRTLRERDGISQEKLAELMTARGHSWHQQTVGRTEKGHRAVKVDELEQLAQIFGVEVGRLLWADDEAQATEFLAKQDMDLRSAWESAVYALIALDTVRGHAGSALRAYAAAEGRVAMARGDLGKTLEGATRDNAISEADRLGRERKP
jgi:transcriptional regulator with XRE-family HTH domain